MPHKIIHLKGGNHTIEINGEKSPRKFSYDEYGSWRHSPIGWVIWWTQYYDEAGAIVVKEELSVIKEDKSV